MSSPHPTASAPWATVDDVELYGCKQGDPTVDDEVLETMLRLASDILYGFTRRRWPGIGVDTIRPCRPLYDVCRRSCSCPGLSEYRLPGQPVTGVTEVWLDGELLDASLYRVDNGRDLVLVVDQDDPGAGPLNRRTWPCCQNMLGDPTVDEHTWQVTYQWGSAPPTGGVVSAAIYGYQLALSLDPAACESGACELPAGTTSVTRDGITVQIDEDVTARGRTGLRVPDAWLASVDLGDTRRSTRAFVPGRSHPARRVG